MRESFMTKFQIEWLLIYIIIMFDYSPSEKDFIKQGLSHGMRSDGRSPTQRRVSGLKCNILDNLSGSSYLSLDQGRIEIYTGVKVRIAECSEGQ